MAQSLFAIEAEAGSDGALARECRKQSLLRILILFLRQLLRTWVNLCPVPDFVCVSCYVMFLNIAMQLHNQFYKLVALGLGTCYIFQVFLTIGGVTKFIPSTGVTLPLVSYGGSSLISTLIMFAIIQGLYILREDEEESIERKKRERLRAKRSKEEGRNPQRAKAADKKRAQGSREKRQAPQQSKKGSQQRIR